MKTVLIELFTSKKFLAALSAVAIYLAGRFGFELDAAALDRIFAALLVYVGAQGVADAGKSAEQLRTTRFASFGVRPPEGLESGAALRGAMPGLALVVVAIALGSAAVSACATVRARATVGVGAMIDCQSDNLRAAVEELVPLATQAVLAAVSGDGRHVDTAAIRAAASALKSDLGRCALATAVAILSAPRTPQPGAPQAAGLEVDGGALRAAFEGVRGELGGVSFRTRAGVL